MNSQLFTLAHLRPVSGDHYRNMMVMKGGKKFFLGLTVHTVHLLFFINTFIVIQGEYTVKGEQWIVHP
ncbi:TPA: hypothetical protein MIH20_18850 [Klebsiella pneumoniae]|nr:hypothetical protein [Klebsiella pneumoniae]HBX8041171.1 hypothetical protein [Klebsiella pneumoniae]HBX8079197.1 hypothetical protein [Klebsiella pneumoniae]HBX8232236.1 hypothetical protein [Klebsiella pneumoniae]